MRLVALISGGKDSIYNMLQCIAANHEIVAVANIEPQTNGELNSYMYQSVGHEAITLIGGALGLPIFRQTTKGKAVCYSKTYVATSNDEVEDLMALLLKVTKKTNIDGVSVGAIASDYQRTRVENVCSRLGLKCFAYLWQRDQIELLQEMIDAEMDAIIIKVACIGLSPNLHLGMNIKDLQPHLLDLNQKYGMNVCGEGGEYETLTLDCPLYNRSITITSSENIILSDDAFAPVGFLKVTSASLENKRVEQNVGSSVILQDKIRYIKTIIKNPEYYIEDCVDGLSEAMFPQRTPKLVQDLPFPFDEEENPEENPSGYIKQYWKEASFMKPQMSGRLISSSSSRTLDITMSTLNYTSGWCCIGNVTGPTITDALNSLQENLERMGYDLKDVVFINLFLRDISKFSAMNSVYSQFLPELKPPARACVETVLEPEVDVLILAVAHKIVSRSQKVLSSTFTEDKEVLHVQSISHWAPANIGPYSQCVKVGEIYYVAGQIPLIPGSMAILNKPIFHQCKLALRHVLRILQAMDSKLTYSNIYQAICYVTSEEIAADVLSLWTYLVKIEHTPICVVVVTELPKKAQLEWEVVACSFPNPVVIDEEFKVIQQYTTYIKRYVNQNPFVTSMVCNVSITAKGKNDVKFFTADGIIEILKYCIQILKKDAKTAGSHFLMLKMFYKTSKTAVALIPDILQSAKDLKIILSAIPVIAFESDVVLCGETSYKAPCLVLFRSKGFVLVGDNPADGKTWN